MGDTLVPHGRGAIQRRARQWTVDPPRRTFAVRRDGDGAWMAVLDAPQHELGLIRSLDRGWTSLDQVEREWHATVQWEPGQLERFQAEHGQRVSR